MVRNSGPIPGRLPAQQARAARPRPRVELLEDRTLPCSLGPEALAGWAALAVDPSAYHPSSVVVRLRPGVAAAASTLGSALPLGADLWEVRLNPGVSVDAALAAYRADPQVLYAQPDYRVALSAATPNDPMFGSLWGLHNTGQSAGTADADVDAPEAWSVTKGTRRTIVAVIDTGVDYTHPDLAANIWTNPGEIPGNGIDDDRNGYIDDVHGYDFANNDANPMDDNGHGTHVAGILGAVGNNGLGVTGVAWNVQIMPLKFMNASGSGYTSDAIRALNYAVANGATISNNSWGSGGYDAALYSAIQSARAAGHIFVTAAGNTGGNNDSTPFYPANHPVDNIVSVTASDRRDNLASFANYGAATVDLAAPGANILSTTPGNTYGWKSGTSMAVPFVTGTLVLLRDLHPDWTYRQLISRVLDTVDRVPALQGKTVTGGRLNVAAALGSTDAYTAFVKQVYQELLGRSADAAGLTYWVQALVGGTSRGQVAEAIWKSAEHRGLQVNRYYVTYLNRAADATGRAYWVSAFLAGASEADVIRALVTSPEYLFAQSSHTSFLSALYGDVLGRAPDAAGRSHWLLALQSGVSRETVAVAVLTSDEAYRRIIDGYYRDYLGRPADTGALVYWLGQLRAGTGSHTPLGTALLASDEFFARAQAGS